MIHGILKILNYRKQTSNGCMSTLQTQTHINRCLHFKHTPTDTQRGNPLIFTKSVWDKNAPSVFRPLHKGQS